MAIDYKTIYRGGTLPPKKWLVSLMGGLIVMIYLPILMIIIFVMFLVPLLLLLQPSWFSSYLFFEILLLSQCVILFVHVLGGFKCSTLISAEQVEGFRSPIISCWFFRLALVIHLVSGIGWTLYYYLGVFSNGDTSLNGPLLHWMVWRLWPYFVGLHLVGFAGLFYLLGVGRILRWDILTGLMAFMLLSQIVSGFILLLCVMLGAGTDGVLYIYLTISVCLLLGLFTAFTVFLTRLIQLWRQHDDLVGIYKARSLALENRSMG